MKEVSWLLLLGLLVYSLALLSCDDDDDDDQAMVDDNSSPSDDDTGDEDLDFTVLESGVYRAELRIVLYHLEPWLGDYPDPFFREYPFIYANPIYIVD